MNWRMVQVKRTRQSFRAPSPVQTAQCIFFLEVLSCEVVALTHQRDDGGYQKIVRRAYKKQILALVSHVVLELLEYIG